MIIPVLFPKFIDTTIAIQIVSIVVIPATIGVFYESKLLALEKGKFPIIAKSMGIIALVSGFLTLGPIYGMIGLAVSFVISSILQTVFIIIASKTIRDTDIKDTDHF